ncbi:ABC transporter ATP-binding protein [Gemmiger sp. An50]|uniref:ABC transporter ATP-binding protein n=1 Tax=Gemmiger sp. An50 TaxID=1965639 RepID=UPI000B38D38A|nr:ABC transporter ATP-binding protein [Gemmiger sp. An50]OUN85436.1 peptide ABC transporter ATP-binding protein [Gemmiger sp. An50]
MPFLEVEHLTKIYGTGANQVKALDDVSFTVEKGQFVAIVGPSGSGKSTLMHLLGGVDRPTGGTVRLSGMDLANQPDETLAVFRRRQIGLVYQFYNLIPLLTVKENLLLPLLLDGRRPAPGQLEGIVEQLGIEGKLDAFPDQLSGGQQQRVSLGRALITRPALLLADEPTGNLDAANTAQVMELLRAIHKGTGQTILMITHDRELAQQAQRVLVIGDGRLQRDEVIRP